MDHPAGAMVFRAIDEPEPSGTWRRLYEEFLPAYRAWFLLEGDAARPSYRECSAALRLHMPELYQTYERLVDLAGGGDLAARLLSLWCPSPTLAGCSQCAILRDRPLLARNYDYLDDRCEMVITRSAWRGIRVVAMSDCLWGCLDGVNDAGLCVSLAFGGRTAVGEGFGIAALLRYVLQTCQSVVEAARALSRVPVHMSYNVTLLDRKGEHATVYVAPDREPVCSTRPMATNHQGVVEWERYAAATQTQEREQHLQSRLGDASMSAWGLAEEFLRPPLWRGPNAGRWRTLYTAVYDPCMRDARFLWPDAGWRLGVDRFASGAASVGRAVSVGTVGDG